MSPRDPNAEYRVYTLRHGTRATMRSDVFLNYASYGQPDGPHVVDYYLWVLVNDRRCVVIDTGFSASAAHRRDRTVLHDPVDMLHDHLGVDAHAVDTVVVTHCHYDHIGNLERFPNARVHMAQAEIDFMRSGLLDRLLVGHFTEPSEIEWLDRLDAEGRLVPVYVEEELVPGVRLIPVGGHTPGQIMVEVDTAAGVVLIASDALHFREELDQDMPFISAMNLPDTYRGFDRIRDHLRDRVAHLIAGHDSAALDGMVRITDDVGVIG
ncbi:MAG: N-acyl homoserine lactonase family protein [Microbacterium sp.]